MAKFLIIRFSSIGDIVLTTPVPRCLRKKFPEAGIHYLTKRSFKNIVEHSPYIDKIHLFEGDLEDVIKELQAENFDFIIDLHHNLRTLRIKHALKCGAYSFNKLNIEKWIVTNFKIDVLPKKHIVERYLDTLKTFDVVDDGMGLDYFIPAHDIVKEKDLPTSHLSGYIGLVIGAAHDTKKLPVEMLKELCDRINHPLILLGGKEDVANGAEIASVDPVKIYNACGKFNLNESADLVRRAKLIITHDTGLMHIAAAFRKRIIVIWGNTIPEFGMYPYQTPYENFEVKKLWCRPCSKIGYDKCPHGHFKCMKKQSLDGIINSANSLLNL